MWYENLIRFSMTPSSLTYSLKLPSRPSWQICVLDQKSLRSSLHSRSCHCFSKKRDKIILVWLLAFLNTVQPNNWEIVDCEKVEHHEVHCFTLHSSSTKPTMTKENFTKFLNEKQRDSRFNEELFPRLRQDQIKALIDKYEPCTTNSNRGKNSQKINFLLHWYFWIFAVMVFLSTCRSDLSRRFSVLPDGFRDISSHAGQAGQVSGYDPTSTPLLHQVLPQHIPDRSNTDLTSALKSLEQIFNSTTWSLYFFH